MNSKNLFSTGQKSKTMSNTFERTNGTAIAAAVGCVFMDRMQEYMELQDTPDFDVQQHLMELYEDLSNLYNDNIQ